MRFSSATLGYERLRSRGGQWSVVHAPTRAVTSARRLPAPFRMTSLRGSKVLTPLARLLVATRLILLRFPLLDALLVPDWPHSKLAVRARYAPEVPPGEVRKHRVPLEPQPPAQSRGVQDLV